ncbi:group III truncated hemoglobin [Pedobacter sp. AW31-3R]|uniref:group III truncated hemoglobin n=1 Tax=Pedobacter sp. AW31-3R TaxID=3445781 RepID=UPI003FA15A2E
MEDLKNKDDIRIVVDGFYDKVRIDPMLGPVFSKAITGDWQPHLEKMYAFWDSILFSVPGFNGNPFAKHVPLLIGQAHFDQWLVLFEETMDDNFSGPVAEEAKKRAQLIAHIFVSRLEGISLNRS